MYMAIKECTFRQYLYPFGSYLYKVSTDFFIRYIESLFKVAKLEFIDVKGRIVTDRFSGSTVLRTKILSNFYCSAFS
jgi:hypothetical protein